MHAFLRSTARFRWILLIAVVLLLLIPAAVMAAGGTFTDDDNSVFEMDIEWLAAHGITAGCNPPANDHFCPDDNVTRGQMAAFLHRMADDQKNVAYQVGHAGKLDIAGLDMYETSLELTGLPEGSYFVIAKGVFVSSELITPAGPRCRLVAGHEFDETSASLEPGESMSWTLTAVTYMAEDGSVIHLDCRDHGEMVSLQDARMTAIGINEFTIQTMAP